MKTKCFIFHNWGKWSKMLEDYSGDRHQFRICKICGKMQKRKICWLNSIKASEVNKSLEIENVE